MLWEELEESVCLPSELFLSIYMGLQNKLFCFENSNGHGHVKIVDAYMGRIVDEERLFILC